MAPHISSIPRYRPAARSCCDVEPSHAVDQAATHPAGDEIDERTSAKPAGATSADDLDLELQVVAQKQCVRLPRPRRGNHAPSRTPQTPDLPPSRKPCIGRPRSTPFRHWSRCRPTTSIPFARSAARHRCRTRCRRQRTPTPKEPRRRSRADCMRSCRSRARYSS